MRTGSQRRLLTAEDAENAEEKERRSYFLSAYSAVKNTDQNQPFLKLTHGKARAPRWPRRPSGWGATHRLACRGLTLINVDQNHIRVHPRQSPHSPFPPISRTCTALNSTCPVWLCRQTKPFSGLSLGALAVAGLPLGMSGNSRWSASTTCWPFIVTLIRWPTHSISTVFHSGAGLTALAVGAR